MLRDSQEIKPNATGIPQRPARLSATGKKKTGGSKGQIDMNSRRWIEQILAKSQELSVTFPWARAPKADAAGSARKSPQDAG